MLCLLRLDCLPTFCKVNWSREGAWSRVSVMTECCNLIQGICWHYKQQKHIKSSVCAKGSHRVWITMVSLLYCRTCLAFSTQPRWLLHKLYQYVFKVQNHLLYEVGGIYSTGKAMAERKPGRMHVWKKWMESYFHPFQYSNKLHAVLKSSTSQYSM